MADLVLRVPLIGQHDGYDRRPPVPPSGQARPSYHGYMACWYASACMVSHYYQPGPHIGLPASWRDDQDLSISAIDVLARTEGLRALPRPSAPLTCDSIAELLQAQGPLWAAGYYLDVAPNAGHAIVLTGVEAPLILYNDPWEPAKKKRPPDWVEGRMLALPNALLAREPGRS